MGVSAPGVLRDRCVSRRRKRACGTGECAGGLLQKTQLEKTAIWTVILMGDGQGKKDFKRYVGVKIRQQSLKDGVHDVRERELLKMAP